MKKCFSTLTSLALFLTTPIAYAGDKQATCKDKYVETMHLATNTLQHMNNDFSLPVNNVLNEIHKLSNELKLQNFEVTVTDRSAYRNGYTTDMYDLTVSYNMTFDHNEHALSKFISRINPINISSSVTKQPCS